MYLHIRPHSALGFPRLAHSLGASQAGAESAEPGSTPFHNGSGDKVTETNVRPGQRTQNLKYRCRKVNVSAWHLEYQTHEFPMLKTKKQNLRARCQQGWFLLGPLVKGRMRPSETSKGVFPQRVVVIKCLKLCGGAQLEPPDLMGDLNFAMSANIVNACNNKKENSRCF